MKAVFRWLCGELNGDMYQAFTKTLTEFNKPFEQLLVQKKSAVFKLESDSDITANETPISPEDLRGIAKIAGVFPPFVTAESNLGSLIGSPAQVVVGVQYSERGLFDMIDERFKFYRTTQNAYSSDITTLATSVLRSSMVPEGAPVLGYIAEGSTVFNVDGTIIPSAILPEPPATGAYVPYYGPKYLFLAETFLIASVVDDDTFKSIFECLQRVRYNFPSITELARLTQLLLQDYLTNMYIERVGYRFVLHYTLNELSSLPSKIKMLAAWQKIILIKYKLLTFQED